MAPGSQRYVKIFYPVFILFLVDIGFYAELQVGLRMIAH